MTATDDFDKQWLERLAACLEAAGGPTLRDEVLGDSADLGEASDRSDVVRWTRDAMTRLSERVDDRTAHDVMTGCACHYPAHRLSEAREAYERTGSVGAARKVLQDQFEDFLRHEVKLDERQTAYVLDHGWGLAGLHRGDRIIATKIPKSAHLAAYLEETDPEKRREMYCHCPRVRDAVRLGESVPDTYCYCGAGFYQGIWEEVLQRPVRVEVLETVLSGGDACVVAVDVGT